ncbi:MAG: DUF3857 and transglutaminase domain-containing protein, partial [Planctomycetota bacterium]|nr:DUF3857 and transglutaminase domain-containing protein [Planctomycetota bacterium]
MRRLFVILLTSLLMPLYGDTIFLQNGEEIEGEIASFENGKFKLKDGRSVKVDNVKSVKFDVAKQEGKKETSQDVKKLLEDAKKAQEKYPYAEHITLLDWGRYELTKEGHHNYEYHAAILICKKEALKIANRSLYFEEGRSKVEVLMSRSIAPDGTVCDYDPSKMKIESPAGEGEFYDYGKYVTYSIPKVEVGSIVEFRYRINEYKPFDAKMFFPSWWFGGKEPVVFSYVEIVVPNDVKLFYKTYDMEEKESKPRILVGKEMTTYSWEYRDFPGIIEEPNMPSIGDVIPRLYGSIFKDWVYLNQWASERLEKNMRLTDAIKSAAEKIVQDAKSDEEKVAAVYHWVQRNIRYISIKGSIMSGMCGHPAWETLQKGYGDCIDVAVLTATLLRALNIEAYPIWIQTNDSEALIDLPNFLGNHAITQVKLGNKFIFLDSTATDYRYPYFRNDDHGTYTHNPLRGVVEPTPVPPPEDNMRNIKCEVRIHPDLSATLEQLNTYTGTWESWVRGWFRTTPPEEHQKFMVSTANSYYPGSKLVDFKLENTEDLSKEFRWHYTINVVRFGTTAGDFLICGMPDVEYNFSEVALPSRRYPIHYTTSYCARHVITVTAPPGWRVFYTPKEVKLQCAHADYEAKYTVSEEGRKILFEDRYRRHSRKIPVKDYEDYKNFLE